jgi:O-antigen/teichoic acid export membrane protein
MNVESGPAREDKQLPELYTLTVRAGLWVFALRMVTRVLEFGQWVILARLLAVQDLGLLGVAMLSMQVLDTFTCTGFQAALIQKKQNVRAYLDSAWTVGVIRGVALCAALYFAAPVVVKLRVPPEKVQIAAALIRVVGVAFFLEGLVNVATVGFQKELRFGRLFVLQAGSSLAQTALTICVAVIYRNIWAMVAGILAGKCARVVLSYVLDPYRPRLSRDFQKAKELWQFGRWILGGAIIDFLLTHGDDFFVWGYLGISSLALYQLAYRLSNIPATEITNVISWVTFPAYSKLQDDIRRLKDAYLKVLQLTAFLSVPVAGLIFILAGDFVQLFMGDKWLPMVPAMRILAIYGLLHSLGATRGPLFQGVGKPWYATKLRAVRLVTLAVIIYPLTKRFGVAGTALAVLLESTIGLPFGTYLAMKVIRAGIFEVHKPILYALAAAMSMMFATAALRYLFFDNVSFVSFAVVATFAVTSYLAVVLVFERVCAYGIGKVLREQLAALRT